MRKKERGEKEKQWFQFKDFFDGMNVVLVHGESKVTIQHMTELFETYPIKKRELNTPTTLELVCAT